MKYVFIVFIVLTSRVSSGQTTCCVAEYDQHAIMDTVTVVVEGKVSDQSTGNGIAGVVITLESEFGILQKISDKNGNFKFFHIPNATYNLMVEKKQYCNVIQDNLSFGSGSIIGMQICLMHSQ